MRILCGFERSGNIRRAFRKLGHDAWSCDLEPADDNSPYHYQCDIRNVEKMDWDLGIFCPPCTDICVSGARWFREKQADGRQERAINLFMRIVRFDIPRIAIENPIGIMSTQYQKPDQIIQPWQFGHGETKATCLWLKNLPKLVPTNIVEGREARIHKMGPSEHRARDRAVTYQGIANAMADQWGCLK